MMNHGQVDRFVTRHWVGRSVLVAGGCGFIGSHIVRALVRHGANVRVVDNLTRGTLKRISDVRGHVDFIRADIKNFSEIYRACQSIDTVFNLAARVGGVVFLTKSQSRLLRENTLIELHLLEAARRCHVNRYLFFSSAAVYPNDAPVPNAEAHAFAGESGFPSPGYAWAKRIGEVQAQLYRSEYHLCVTSIRPFNVCGVGEYYRGKRVHVIPSLIARSLAARKRLGVLGDGRQTRSFIDVEDLVRLSLFIAEHGTSLQQVNISSPREISIAALSRIVLKSTGRTDLEIQFRPGPIGVTRSVPDLSLLQRLTPDYTFVPLEATICRMVEEYKEQQCAPLS